jgi:dolichol-phosphate mannosyltransferase
VSIAATVFSKVRDAEANHKELARFLLVGGSGTFLNFVILTATYRYLHWPDALAALISNETAMVSNFFCHEHWTFRDERHGTRKTRFLRYQFVAVGGIAISTILFTIFVHLGLYYLFANAIAIVLALSWNFAMSHRWAWRRMPVEALENVA